MAEENIVSIKNPNTVGFPKETPTKSYDFFGSVLNAAAGMGEDYDVNKHLINMKISIDDEPGSQMDLHDPETLWKKNEKKYQGNRKQFDLDYENTSKLYNAYKKDELDYYSYASPTNFYSEMGGKPVAGVGVVIDKNPNYNYGWMNKLTANLTPDQMAAMSGKYLDREGKEQEFDWTVKFNPLKPIVVSQNQETGAYYLRESDIKEDLSNQRMYSFWGAQGKYGNAIVNTAGAFLSELIPGTVDVLATMGKIGLVAQESFVDLLFKGTKDENALSIKNAYGAAKFAGDVASGNLVTAAISDYFWEKNLPISKKETLNAISNLANKMKFNPSQEAEQAGWTGSMEGFMTNLGRGLSYLLPQRGVAIGMAKMFARTAVKPLAKGFIAKYGAKEGEKMIEQWVKNYPLTPGEHSIVNAAGFGTGTVQAISGVYTAGKQHGLSDEEAAWMSVAASPFVYATEKMVGGGWLWKELKTRAGQQALLDEVKGSIKHQVTESGFQSIKELGEKEFIEIGKNAISGFIKKSKDLGFKAFNKIKDQPGFYGAVREGAQEASEESLYVAEEIVFDKIKELGGDKKSYNTSFTSDETANRLRDSWIGGFFIGGVADAYLHRGKAADQKDAIIDAIVNNKSEDLRKQITKFKDAGQLGQTHLSENGSIITTDQVGKVKSINDINYDNILQQIEFYENLYKVGGLNTKAAMDNVGGDKSLITEGMDNLLNQYNLNEEIKGINKELEKAQGGGFSTEQLSKDVALKTQELDKLKTSYQDIVSGKRLADLTKDSLIKNLYDQYGESFKGADQITSENQDAFNSQIPEQKKIEIEALKTEKEKLQAARIESGTIVPQFASLDITNFTPETAEVLSKIKIKAESGELTQEDSKKLIAEIEKKKGELINSLEQGFGEVKVSQLREAATEIQGEDKEFNVETYTASLINEARNAPTIRTNVKVGDIVQKVDKEGNPTSEDAPVISINEDGSLVLSEQENAVDVSEIKNITASQELEAQAQEFSKQSDLERAYQSLAGINTQSADLESAYGFNEDAFMALAYSSTLVDGRLVPITDTLSNITGMPIDEIAQLEVEELITLLEKAPLMQIPETKTALENILKTLKTYKARLLTNLNVYQQLDRKMSGMTNDNILTNKQALETLALLDALVRVTDNVLSVVDRARLDRQIRQSKFRRESLNISHFLIGQALTYIDGPNATKINQLLIDAKKEMDGLAKSQQEGTIITDKDYIPLRKLITQAETLLHEEIKANPKIAEKALKDMIASHGMITAYTSSSEFNANTVDQLFNVGNFVTSSKENKTGIPQNVLDSFVMFTSVNYYQNISRLNPSEFASAFKESIGELDAEYDNIPSFEQESIINHVVAFLSDPEDGLIQYVNDTLKRAPIDNFLWNSLFLRGFYGTGKTTTIGKLSLKVFAKLNGKKARVLAVAPNEELAAKLEAAIADEVSDSHSMSNEAFLANGIAIVNNYDIILFDEASRLDNDNLNRINEILLGDNSNNTTKAIMMGDQSQMQSIKYADGQLPIELRAERTIPATEIFRTGVEDIWAVLEAIRVKMNALDNNFILPPTRYKADKSRGVLLVNTNDAGAIVKEFANDMLANPEHIQNSVIVTFSERDRSVIINDLLSNTALVEKFTAEKLNDIVRHLDEGNKNAQGLQFERVYVAITKSMMPAGNLINKLFSKALLTAGSRAINYMVLPNENGVSKEGNPASILSETRESRTEKLDALRAWWAWADPLSQSEATEQDTPLVPGQGTPSGPPSGPPPPPGKPSSKKPTRGFQDHWVVGNTVFLNIPEKGTILSSINGQIGTIKSFVLNNGIDKLSFGTYEEMMNAYDNGPKVGPAFAFIEVQVGKDTYLVSPKSAEKYTPKKANKQKDQQPAKNQNSLSEEQLEKGGISLKNPYKHKISGKIVKVTRGFERGNGVSLIIDGDESNPIAKSTFLKNYVEQKGVGVIKQNQQPVTPDQQHSSKVFSVNKKLIFGMFSNQGTTDQDNPNDPYVKFKRALIGHILNKGPMPVTLSLENDLELATTKGGFVKFNNVVTVRFTGQSDMEQIAKRLGVKVDFNKASLIGTLPQPELKYADKFSENANYRNEADVQTMYNKITGGGNTFDHNKFLVQIREHLANNGPIQLDFTGVQPGSFKYVDDNQKMIPFTDLVKTLEAKGFIVSKSLHFKTNIPQKKGNVLENMASVIATVRAFEGVPENVANEVILNSEKVTDQYFKDLTKNISDLEKTSGLTLNDIDNSVAFKFLLFNSSRINRNGVFMPGLDQFLEIKPAGWIDLKGKTPVNKVFNLSQSVAFLNNLYKQNDPRIVEFNQLVQKSSQGGVFMVDPNGVFFTRVRDVNMPQGELDISAISNAFAAKNDKNIAPPVTGKSAFKSPSFKQGKPKIKTSVENLTNSEKRELRSAVLRFYERIFGQDFLDNRLEFKRSITLNEDALYGLVANGKVFLEETDKGIEIHTKAHEAVHIALNYLISPESKAAILQDAKLAIQEQTGADIRNISDNTAEEFIATRNETRYKGIGGLFNRLIDRFNAWVNRVFGDIDSYKEEVDSFLFAIENGYFKDRPFYENNSDIMAPKMKPKKGNESQIQKYGTNDNSELGENLSTGVVNKQFNSLQDLNQLSSPKEGIDNEYEGIKPEDEFKNYSSLSGIFGNIESVDLIRRQLGTAILSITNYNRNITEEGYSFLDAIQIARKNYIEGAQEIGQIINVADPETKTVYTSLAEINGSNVKYLDEADYIKYVNLKLADPIVFNTFIKKMLPGANFKKADLGLYYKNENDEHENEEWTEEENLMANNSININDRNNETDPFGKMSKHVTFHLTNMRVNQYRYDQNGHRTLVAQSDNYIPAEKLKMILTQATIDAQIPNNENEKNLTELERFTIIVRNMAQTATQKGESSPMADVLWTFFDNFINEVPVKSELGPYYSHLYLRKNKKDLIKNNPQSIDIINQKVKDSSNILTATFSFFKSLRRNQYAQLAFSNQDYNLKVVKLSASSHEIERSKNEMNQQINAVMFIKSLDTHAGISESFTKIFTEPKKKFFQVEKDNIFLHEFGRNKPFIKVNVKNGVPQFTLDAGVTNSDVISTLKKFGLRMSPRTIQLFLGNDAAESRIAGNYTRQSLAEILGMYIFTGFSSSTDGPHAVKILTQAYYNKHGLKVDSVFREDNPDEEPSNDEESEKLHATANNVDAYFKPSDLFPLTRLLASADAYTNGKEFSNFFQSANGNTKALVTYKAYLDLFFSTDSSGSFIANKIKANAELFLKNNPALANLPYLDPNSTQGIISSEILDEAFDNMGRSKSLGRMNDGELADAFIHAFINSVNNSQGSSEELIVPYHNVADKDQFRIMKVNLSTNDQERFLMKRGDQWTVNKSILTNNINKLFDYFLDVHQESITNLHGLFMNSGISKTVYSLEDVLKNPDKLSFNMMNAWESIKGDPLALNTYREFVKNIKKNSGLRLSKDFILLTENINGVDEEIIMPGKAAHFNHLSNLEMDRMSTGVSNPGLYKKYLNKAQGHALFNAKTFAQWNTPYAEGMTSDAIVNEAYARVKDIFGDQFAGKEGNGGFIGFLKSVKHSTPQSIQGLFVGDRGTFVYRKPIIDVTEEERISPVLKKGEIKLTTTTTEKSERRNIYPHRNWEWNPFYEAFFFSYLMNDIQTSSIFMGDYSLFKDYTDFLKRTSQLEAPGIWPDTSNPEGVGPKRRIVIFDDPKSSVYKELEEYNKSKGLPSSGKYEEFNGSGFMNPIFYHLLSKDFGGAIGSLGKGVLKPVHNEPGIYIKYADTVITGQMAENSPEIQSLVDRMFISRELAEMFDGIIEKYRKSDLTYGQAFNLASMDMADYIGENGLQDQIIAELIPTSSVKNGALHINQLDDEDWVTVELDNQFFRIQTNLEQDIEKTGLSNYNQMYAQMSIGVHNTDRVNRLNKIQEAIASDYLGFITTKIKQSQKNNNISEKEAWSRYIKKIGLDATENIGQIGFFVDLLNTPSSSINIPILRTKLKQYFANRITQNAIKPKMNGVRHNQSPSAFYKVFDYNGLVLTNADIERLQKKGLLDVSKLSRSRSLKPMRVENGVLQPAEVLLNYSYVEQFGIDKNDTLEEARSKMIEQDKITPGILEEFEKTLNVIVGRIPANKPSSAFIGKVVGFINDSSNTIIFPSEQNVLTNADFDGDQVNVYFYDLKQTQKALNNNRILDVMFEYFKDPLNQEIIFSPIELVTFRNALQEKLSKIENRANSMAPSTPQGFFFTSRLINEGKNMTGRFANAVKTYSFLVQAINNNDNKNSNEKARSLTTFVLNKDGKTTPNKQGASEFIIDFLGKLLQSSVDNAKELILGALGVDSNNGNILTAMAIEGNSPQEAFEFFSLPHINKVFSDLYSTSRLTKYTKNEMGEKFGMLDQIKDVLLDLKNDKGIVVPEDQEYQLFKYKQAKSVGVKIEEESDQDTFFFNESSYEYNTGLADPDTELADILSRRAVAREKAQVDLLRLANLELKGTALFRLTTAVGINTSGIPVFEYEMDKYINDLSFIFNQPISNYFSNKPEPVDINYWKTHKKYASKEAMEVLEKREKTIRETINNPEVIHNIPHIKEFLRILDWVKNRYSEMFSHDSKFEKNVQEKFLASIGIDSLSYEDGYKLFNREKEKFKISLFFDSQYGSTSYDDVLNLIPSQEKLFISSPEGRIRFGYQFPTYVEKELKENPKYADNSFLMRLVFPNENHGKFIELYDSTNITDEQMAQIRKDFEKLTDKDQEMFTNYFLMKDGFIERKGSIMKVIGAKAFNKYSSFADSFHEMVRKHDEGRAVYYTFSNGQIVTLDELFDNSFLKDVQDNVKNLLQNEASLIKNQIPVTRWPAYFKKTVKKGQYKQSFVVSKDTPELLLRLMYMPRFNSYDPSKSAMTSKDTLRVMNWDDYYKLKANLLDSTEYGVEIKFKGVTSFKAGQLIHIIDGTLVRITRVTNRNSIFIKDENSTSLNLPVASLRSENDFKDSLFAAAAVYTNINNKKDFLSKISTTSMSDYYRELAKALMASPRVEEAYKRGTVNWVTVTNPEIIRANPTNPDLVQAAFNPYSGDVLMRSDAIINPFMIEKSFLHELIHNITLDTLRRPFTTLTDTEKAFVTNINSLYLEALAIDAKNGNKFKDQFRSVEEFVTEALTSPSVQAMLASTVSNVNTISSSLWDKFIDLLSTFFSGGANQYNVPGSILAGVVSVTGNFVTSPISVEERTKISDIFGRMNEVTDKSVDEMMKNCK